MADAATIILYKQDKKILLQHRDNNAKRFPNIWGLFGGAIENNEKPIEAVKRECKEELDYKLKKPLLIYKAAVGKSKTYVFIEKYDSSKKLNLREGKNMGWFEIRDLKKNKMIPHAWRIIKKVENIIKEQT